MAINNDKITKTTTTTSICSILRWSCSSPSFLVMLSLSRLIIIIMVILVLNEKQINKITGPGSSSSLWLSLFLNKTKNKQNHRSRLIVCCSSAFSSSILLFTSSTSLSRSPCNLDFYFHHHSWIRVEQKKTSCAAAAYLFPLYNIQQILSVSIHLILRSIRFQLYLKSIAFMIYDQ